MNVDFALPLDTTQYQYHYTTGEHQSESTQSDIVTRSSNSKQFSSSSRVVYPRSSISANPQDAKTHIRHANGGEDPPTVHDSSQRTANLIHEDQSQIQRGERPTIPVDLIDELFPNGIQHDNSDDSDLPPPIDIDSHYPASLPVAVVTDVYNQRDNIITNDNTGSESSHFIQKLTTQQSDHSNSYSQGGVYTTTDRHTTSQDPPTIFHQDYYLDIEELLKQLESNTEDYTDDFDYETHTDFDDSLEDTTDVGSFWDTYNENPHEDSLYNPGVENTDILQNTSTFPPGTINDSNSDDGNINHNTNYNTGDYYPQDEQRLITTTTNSYQALDAVPLDDLYPPPTDSSNTNSEENSDINFGNSNASVTTHPIINTNNQHTIPTASVATQSNDGVNAAVNYDKTSAILGITQSEITSNNNSTLDYIFSSSSPLTASTIRAAVNTEQQTADPQPSRDFDIHVYEGVDADTHTQTTLDFGGGGGGGNVYIPSQEDLSNNNDSNPDFIGSNNHGINESNTNLFPPPLHNTNNTDFIFGTTTASSLFLGGVENIDVTGEENDGNLNIENNNNTGSKNSTETTVSPVGNSNENSNDTDIINNNDDEYSGVKSGFTNYFSQVTTTISQFDSSGSDIVDEVDTNYNNKHETGINSNHSTSNKDTVTTSDYTSLVPLNQNGDVDASKSDEVSNKKTDKDHTKSKDTGIILGSTLTIAAVIVLGIMITLCCACLRKNKGDKDPGSGVAGGDSYTYAGGDHNHHHDGKDADNSSEESYGFSSSSTSRRRAGNTHDTVAQSDNYGIESGMEMPVHPQQQQNVAAAAPPPAQKSGLSALGGFSFASLTWKRKDKKKKERYNANNGNTPEDNITVQERIKAFEGKMSPASEAKFAAEDESKPRKKKPKSQAFQDFENTGLIIGFGNPRKPKTSETEEEDVPYTSEFPGFPDVDPDEQAQHKNQQHHYHSRDYRGSNEDRINDEEGLGSMGSMEYRMPCLSKSQESDRSISLSSGSKLTEDEGIHTMDSEDDELGNAVPRQTEILKSFRRAPPPRNRGRGRRSMNRRGPHKEDTSLCSLELPEEDENEIDSCNAINSTSSAALSPIYQPQTTTASVGSCNSIKVPHGKELHQPNQSGGKNTYGQAKNDKVVKNSNSVREFGRFNIVPSAVSKSGGASGNDNNGRYDSHTNKPTRSSPPVSFKNSQDSNPNRNKHSKYYLATENNAENVNFRNTYNSDNKLDIDKSSCNQSSDWKSHHPYDSSPLWKSKSMGNNILASNNNSRTGQSDSINSNSKSNTSSLVWKENGQKEDKLGKKSASSNLDTSPSWINRNYDVVKEEQKNENSSPPKQQFKLDTNKYKIHSGMGSPSNNRKSTNSGSLNAANNYKTDRNAPLYKNQTDINKRTSTGNVATATSTPPPTKFMLDNNKQSLQFTPTQQRLLSSSNRAKSNTPPPSTLGLKSDSNNNGSSLSNIAGVTNIRARTKNFEGNNNNFNFGYGGNGNQDYFYSPTGGVINNTAVAEREGNEQPPSSQNRYKTYEAEATFSDQGGNYSFYTPNPLEQDSDDENNKHEKPMDTSDDVRSRYRRSNSQEIVGSGSSSGGGNTNKRNDSCDDDKRDMYTYKTDRGVENNGGFSNRNSNVDGRVAAACDNEQREQLSFGANSSKKSNVGGGGGSGTPLSGLGQSTEVTYKTSYNPSSIGRVPYSNKKPFTSVRPCFENILPPHKALSTSSNNNVTHQHVSSEYQNTAAISPTIYNNKIQEETTNSYHTHHQSSDLPPNTPPKVPPRGLTYLRRNSSGCGLDKDETTSPPPKSLGSVGGIGSVGEGYGIASRAHDLQLYSDMSVVPQSTPSVPEKQTFDTAENNENDDVFFNEINHHDSGYYSRQASRNNNSTSSTNLSPHPRHSGSTNNSSSLNRYNNASTTRQPSNYSSTTQSYPSANNSTIHSPMDTNSSAHSSSVQSPLDSGSYSHTTSLSNIQSPSSPISPIDDADDDDNEGGNHQHRSAYFSNSYKNISHQVKPNSGEENSSFLTQPRRSHSQNDSFYSNAKHNVTHRQVSDEQGYRGNKIRNRSCDSKSEKANSLERSNSTLKFNADFEGTCV